MIDMVQVTIDIEWEIVHILSTCIFTYDPLTMSNCKGQSQGYAHFNIENLGKGEK